MEILELHTQQAETKTKSSWDQLGSRREITEERINELDDKSMKMIQSEQQREQKRLKQ